MTSPSDAKDSDSNAKDLAVDQDRQGASNQETIDIESLMGGLNDGFAGPGGPGYNDINLEPRGGESLNMNPSGDLPLEMSFLEDSTRSKEDIERERMKLLVSHFDEQQMSRYAAFRRANIRKAVVKKYASQLLNQPISNSVAVVLAGMSKVLVGDIIELARDLQERERATERQRLGIPEPPEGSEPEPLLPTYIREAWKIYKEESGTVPGSKLKPGSSNRFF